MVYENLARNTCKYYGMDLLLRVGEYWSGQGIHVAVFSHTMICVR